MKREHSTGVVVFALLLMLIGTLGVNDRLLGRAASTALVPSTTAAPDVPHVESASDAENMIQEVLQNPQKVRPLPPELIDSETLWLARVIYSETKRPEEMELVAWVVRNRVETQYRGKRSYRDAVLDPFQFSAFNGGRKRTHYSSLTPTSRAPGFATAIGIAYSVRHARPDYRPFSQRTRHFYSERSMVGVKHPNWARGGRQVIPQRSFQVDELRFRFFENVA